MIGNYIVISSLNLYKLFVGARLTGQCKDAETCA